MVFMYLNDILVICLFTAMMEVPKVISVTTSSVWLEFQEANDTTHNYQVEYAELIFSSVVQYVKGVKIDAVPGQSTYRILQTGLIPGRQYQLRIIPNIYIVRTDYGGIPSGGIKVVILVPGRKNIHISTTKRSFCIMSALLFHLFIYFLSHCSS